MGSAEIVGVPRAVLRAFSRRRVEIEAAMARHGAAAAEAAEAAALGHAAREGPRRVARSSSCAEWRARAARHGLHEVARSSDASRPRPRRSNARLGELFEDLAGPQGLTRSRATFCRRDVIQALCERFGGDGAIEAAERHPRSSHVVAILESPQAIERFRRSDARDRRAAATPRVSISRSSGR